MESFAEHAVYEGEIQTQSSKPAVTDHHHLKEGWS